MKKTGNLEIVLFAGPGK